jgi:hypothetical protein
MSDERFNARFQRVTCAACGKSYVCTPTADYYNSTTDSDGVCESCLLAGAKGANPPDPNSIGPLLQQMIDSGRATLAEDGTVSLAIEDRLFDRFWPDPDNWPWQR